ncbi:hypothetical protein AAC387_Pa06g1633 [Persea americana]
MLATSTREGQRFASTRNRPSCYVPVYIFCTLAGPQSHRSCKIPWLLVSKVQPVCPQMWVLYARVGDDVPPLAQMEPLATSRTSAAQTLSTQGATAAPPDAGLLYARFGGDGPRLARMEPLATSRSTSSPDTVGALIADVKGPCMGDGEEEREEDEGEERKGWDS